MSKKMNSYVYGILGFVVLLVGLWYSTCLANASSYEDEFEISIQAVEKYDMAYELLSYINQERENLGLQPLVMDRQLMETALIRATEVNVLNSHWRPNGTRFTSTMGVEAVYENINSYAVSAKSVYEGWMASTDGHKTPVIDPACRAVGIGIVNHAAVAEFSYSEPEEIKLTGTNSRMRQVQLRLSLCRFSLSTGNSLEYGGQDKLMLVSTIENQGVPTEIDMAQFQISSSDPDTITVMANGVLRGNKAGSVGIKVVWRTDTSIVSDLTIPVKPLDISVQGNAGFIYEQTHAYSGTSIEPPVTVTDKYGSSLQEGKDFSLSYTDNVDNGTALIEVQGMGNYSGTRYLSFSIEKVSDSTQVEQVETDTQNTETESTFLANFNYIAPTVTLSQRSYPYDGTAKTPAVAVSVKGEQLQEGMDYRVSYENNVNPGQAVVVIQGINRCSGEYRVTFSIEKETVQSEAENVKTTVQTSTGSSATTSSMAGSSAELSADTGNERKAEAAIEKNTSGKETSAGTAKKVTVKQPKIQKIKRSKKKQLTVYWKKDKTVSGYQIQIATNKKMSKGKKTIAVSKKKTSYTVKKLKSKRTYYVRIRSYKKVKGKIYYSKWSQIKAVKVK